MRSGVIYIIPKYMPLYIAEACFKYNRRSSSAIFDQSIQMFVGA